MSLINCKVELSLKWIENCVLTTSTNANKATFKIADAKLYVPIVTLSAEENARLSKLLGEGFKRYKVVDDRVVEIADNNEEKDIRKFLDSSYQGVKRLFVLLFIIIQKVIIKFLLIFLKNIFFQELKSKITTSKLMEEIFIINQ